MKHQVYSYGNNPFMRDLKGPRFVPIFKKGDKVTWVYERKTHIGTVTRDSYLVGSVETVEVDEQWVRVQWVLEVSGTKNTSPVTFYTQPK